MPYATANMPSVGLNAYLSTGRASARATKDRSIIENRWATVAAIGSTRSCPAVLRGMVRHTVTVSR